MIALMPIEIKHCHLVNKIDADLFESIVFKYFKPGNIQNSAEVDLLHLGVNQRLVTLLDQPLEQPVVDGPRDAARGVGGLVHVLALGHPLGAHLDARLAEGLQQRGGVHAAERGGPPGPGAGLRVGTLRLLVPPLLLVAHLAEGHDGRGQLVAVQLLSLTEPQHIEGV